MTVPYELQIIHKQSGVQLFSHRFREDIKLDPTLISGFITAVITFAEELKPSEGKEMVKYIDRGDFILQVEPGELIVGLLILSSKDYSFKEKLKILVREFERNYKKDILNFNGFAGDFAAFEEKVKQLITSKAISPYHIPKLINTDRAPKKLDDIKWAIITRINGQNDINTISEELDLSVDVVQSIIGYFEEVGLVRTFFKINDKTVLELTRKGLKALDNESEQRKEVISIGGEPALEILALIGNQKVFREIKENCSITEAECITIIEKLVSEKYLEILPQWKLVLEKKDFQFTRSLEFIDDLFQLIYDEVDNWLNRRELERLKRDTYALLVIKDETLARLISEQFEFFLDRNNLKKYISQIGDLTQIANNLEELFKVLQSAIERLIGSNLTRDILLKVATRLNTDYNDLLEQQEELQTIFNWLK
ncbi:MAG: hypothetical protein ACTSXO_08245 [Candidatus Heimdallarchaeota archaeon]